MTDQHEVISAFLDNEPFEARTLGDALAGAEGRAMLLDLIALRHLVREDPLMAAAPPKRSNGRLKLLAAAAAVLLALIGGYQLGERRSIAAADEPPAPTRVVPATANWQ